MYEISVEETFDAAHCLRDYQGNCQRLHGHTYRVKAAFRFTSVQQSGLAFDFRQAKEILREILHYMDHQYINELPEFLIQNTSAENIAKFIYDRIETANSSIYSVSVWETPNSCATYIAD